MTSRPCLACDHRYTGGVRCPACREASGEPVDDAYRRPVGRPRKPAADKRDRERIAVSRNEMARLMAWSKARGFRSVADMVLDGCP